MLAEFANVLIFIVVAILFLVVSLFMSRLFRYTGSKGEERFISYECGENPTGNAWIQFNIRFLRFRFDLHHLRRGSGFSVSLGGCFQGIGHVCIR